MHPAIPATLPSGSLLLGTHLKTWRERQPGSDRPMTTQHRRYAVEQFGGASRAQRLPADHRANAADRNEVRSRYGAAAPEKQGHDARALASGIDGKCPELIIERTGERTQETPRRTD
jgi:hypothetical protein